MSTLFQKSSIHLIGLGGAALGLSYYIFKLHKKIKLGDYLKLIFETSGSVVWSKWWFSELSSLWPGQSFSIQVEKILYDKKSEYQHIQVFDCGEEWGRVLVLDGAIQCTEKDEFAYQEMMTHIPLTSHPNPKKVLVIGGGDGGILRGKNCELIIIKLEIGRHPGITEIHICELDIAVIAIAKQFFPTMACGFDDPRVQVHISDGFDFIKPYKDEFDVIIVDSSDFIGPAKILYDELFFEAAAQALTSNGILCCQGECMWLHLDIIKSIKSFATKLFSCVEYAFMSVPSYPCGTIGALCCSKSTAFRCSYPLGQRPNDLELITKFYTEDIHKAAFILPNFVSKALMVIDN